MMNKATSAGWPLTAGGGEAPAHGGGRGLPGVPPGGLLFACQSQSFDFMISQRIRMSAFAMISMIFRVVSLLDIMCPPNKVANQPHGEAPPSINTVNSFSYAR